MPSSNGMEDQHRRQDRATMTPCSARCDSGLDLHPPQLYLPAVSEVLFVKPCD